LFHENSKRRTFELELRAGFEEEVQEPGLKKSLNVAARAEISLSHPLSPANDRINVDHEEGLLGLGQLAELLLSSYGAVHGEQESTRPIYSEGSRWPVELYCWHPGGDGVETGLYYFNPERHTIVLMPDQTKNTVQFALEYTDIKKGVVLFITALFKRSTGYFGERGYRYSCLEA
jgi:hypothetical protein